MATRYLRLTASARTSARSPRCTTSTWASRKGEFVCFLGPSGCGKTTLLRIIAGLEVQSAGRIGLAGRDISALPPAQRDYGIVFQSYALFPNLTRGRQRGLRPGQSQGAAAAGDAQRVAELVKLVGLPGSEAKYPAQLSGGQQQRIALARALATSPGLLLLDEPLSALDALVRVQLRQEIRALQRKLGVTTIMVTHDQEEAFSVADRIVVMNQGAIEQVGTPLEMYREPASPFVADFVGKVNVLPAHASSGGRLRVGALRFHCEHAFGDGSELRVYLRPEDVLARPIADGDPHVFDASIEKIEFLGSYCHGARGRRRRWPSTSSPCTCRSTTCPSSRSRSAAACRCALLPERMRVF